MRHVYTSRITRFRKRSYFFDAATSYSSTGAQGKGVACVVDWWPHQELNATWTFRGPDDREVVIANHNIPTNSDVSWEVLHAQDQVPGRWICEVTVEGKPPIVTRFELRAPDA